MVSYFSHMSKKSLFASSFFCWISLRWSLEFVDCYFERTLPLLASSMISCWMLGADPKIWKVCLDKSSSMFSDKSNYLPP